MNLFDKYLKKHQFSKQHSIIINAAPAKVISAITHYDFEKNAFVRAMLKLRELPARLINHNKNRSQKLFGLHDFYLLEGQHNTLLYGLLGRFWQADGGLITITNHAEFIKNDDPEIVKLVFGFTAHKQANGFTKLKTETRAFCPDRASLCKFTPYWYFIHPISGLIRRQMLRDIKAECESF